MSDKMPAQPEGFGPEQLLGVVGTSARMQGTFDIADSIQIECEVGGQLTVGKRLVIGRQGVVHADVKTVDAVIHGTYEGNLVATGDVEIAATGRVTGNLQTNSLVIAKGGFFNGNVAAIGAEPASMGTRSNEQAQVYSLSQRRAGANS